MDRGNYFPGERFLVLAPFWEHQFPVEANGRYAADTRQAALDIASWFLGEMSDTCKAAANRFLEGGFSKSELWCGTVFGSKTNPKAFAAIILLSPNPAARRK